MKALLFALMLLSTPVFADCVTPNENDLGRHGCYHNRFGDERHVPAPDAKGVPQGATARCRDGDYSFSAHHSGTCSSHKGVAEWLKP
jgi:hypothetical protein